MTNLMLILEHIAEFPLRGQAVLVPGPTGIQRDKEHQS